MSVGIVSWGVYLPYWRLQRSAIGATLGGASGRGTRTVASFDEDTTTMGVEAARRALAALDGDGPLDAAVRHPGAGLHRQDERDGDPCRARAARSAGAYDLAGSVRSSVGAVRAAAAMSASAGRTMAVLSDLRTGLAGSRRRARRRRRRGGARVRRRRRRGRARGQAAHDAEFLDRWRTPGETESRQWEERFGEEVYLPLVEAAFTEALEGRRAVTRRRRPRRRLRAARPRGAARRPRRSASAPRRWPTTAPPGRQPRRGAARAAARRRARRAEPGELIALVVLADGADVLLLRTTERCRRPEAGGPRPACVPSRELVDGRPRRPPLRPVPDLARRAAPRAAPPSRSRAARRAGDVAFRPRGRAGSTRAAAWRAGSGTCRRRASA